MLLLFQQDFTSTDTIIVQHDLNQDVGIRIVDDTNTINNNLVDRLEFDSVDPYNKVIIYLKSVASGRVQILDKEVVLVTTADKIKIDEVQDISIRVNNILSTGLLTGGEITINISDPTKFDIAAGAGYVVDNYTDPKNPVVSYVEWEDKVGILDAYLSVVEETSVAIDKNGNVRQQDYYFTDEERRDYIILGFNGHLNNDVLEYIIIEPSVVFDVKGLMDDFFENFGAFNIYGNEFFPNGANLYINKTEGTTFDPGTNYKNSKKSPNIFYSEAFEAPVIKYYNRDSYGEWQFLYSNQSIITNKYDDGTELKDVPTGNFTIIPFFFYAPTESVEVQFGQTIYTSIINAEASLYSSININPFFSFNTFRGWLIVASGATELNDAYQAKFITVNGQGMFSSANGFGDFFGKTTASNIGTEGVGVFDNKVDIDFQFRNINSGSEKISVVLNDGYHTVDLDVVEGYLSHKNFLDIGTNTHGQIDSHIGSTSNPHSVTSTQVGKDIAQWNADRLEGYSVASTQPTNGQVLAWDSGISKYKPVTGAAYDNVIIVAKSGGDFTSVKVAIDSITDASIVNPYVVKIEPGVYSEDPFTLKSFVGVIGQGDEFWGVSISTTDNSAHFITGAAGASLQRVSVTGPSGTGYAAIDYSTTSPIPFELRDILIRKGYYGLYCHPSGFGMVNTFSVVPTFIGSVMNKFIYVTDYGRAACFNCACSGPPPYTLGYGFYVDGVNADVSLDLCTFGVVGAVGAFADNGAKLRVSSCSFSLGVNAFECGSGGTNTRVYVSGTTIGESFTYDFKINTASSVVSFNGVGHRNKLLVPIGTNFSASFTDPTDGYQGQVVLGELWFGTVEKSFALGTYTKETASTGLLSGGDIQVVSGLTISVLEGYGYINDGVKVYDVKWPYTEITLTANKEQIWIYVDIDNLIKEMFISPDDTLDIVLGVATTGASYTQLLSDRYVYLLQSASNRHIYARDVVGPISVSGCLATKHATTSLQLDVGSGTYYIYDNRKNATGHALITFTYWYRDGAGGWTKSIGHTAIDPDGYDVGSGTIATVPSTEYKGDLLFLTDDGYDTQYHCVYAQETETTSGGVINNPVVPDVLTNNGLRVARIIVQKSSNNIDSIIDQRPKLGQLASGSSSISKHGDLSGLDLNDHGQYQLRTERNAASGYCGLDVGAKVSYTYLPFTGTAPSQITITSAAVGSSNQICFSDHVHSVSTATAGGLTVGGSSAEGSATSLSRSDHNHGLAAFGTALGTFCQGSDGRLSDDRTASGLRSATTVVSISSATAPSIDQFLRATSSTAATWQTVSIAVVSDTAPLDVLVQTAAAGSSAGASRVDHKHNVSVGSPVSVGTANADGAATSLARSNHVHSGLTRNANDFSVFTLKSVLASADVILLEDSAAAGVKKYTTVSSFHGDFANGGDVAAAARSLGNNSAYDLYLRTNSANVLHITSGGEVKVLGSAGYLYSERYIMGSGPDLSCIPVSGGQSVITTWWGLQLVGNKQSNVNYTPTNYGAAGDFSVIIPNQQAASIGLVIQGQTAQTGDLVRWRNSSSTVLSKVTPDGLIVAPNINNCRRVRVATTTAITLTGAQTIDFISVVAGDLVLVKDQGTGSQNGIYVCATGAWAYASDWQTGFVFAETYVSVSEGVANVHTTWRVNNTGAITVGTTAIVFTRTFMSRDAGDINSFTVKTTTVGSDIVLIEDSESAYNKKKMLLSALPKRWPFSKVLTVDKTDTDADYSTIQAAIDAASAGMTILISPGAYAETISLKDGVDLFGLGGAGIGYPNTTTYGVWIYSLSGTIDLITLLSGSCSISNIGVKLARSGGTPTMRAVVCSGTKLQLNNCHVEIDAGGFPAGSFTTIQVTAGELTLLNCNVVATPEYVAQTLDYGLYVSGAGTVNVHNSRFTPDVSTTAQCNIYINNASAVVNLNGCYVQGDCVRTLGVLNLYGGNQLDHGVTIEWGWPDPIDGTGASFKQWDAVRIDGSNEQYKVNLKAVTGDVGTPANGDIWYNDSTGKFRVQENGASYNLTEGTSVFGNNFQQISVDARTTTTSNSYQIKATLTTPALTGTYRVAWSAITDLGTTTNLQYTRLYNNTDAVAYEEVINRCVATTQRWPNSGIDYVTFAGAAKTFYVQWRAGTSGNTAGCAFARIELWRVS